MAIDVIVGLQRGDEGKGRVVDLLAPHYDIVARGNGGANAGHTIVPEGKPAIALHQIPSGIAYPNILNIIGPGTYVDPVRLITEIEELRAAGYIVNPDNLMISSGAHLVMPHHITLDTERESGAESQGSTKRGIAYVAASKQLREGQRMEALNNPSRLQAAVEAGLESLPPISSNNMAKNNAKISADWIVVAQQLTPFMADTVSILNEKLEAGTRVLGEGAQAFWLDINHGMYPYVTSSPTTVNGLLDGLGVSSKHLGTVIGVAKVVKSHVGGGPFVTEIHDDTLAARIRGIKGEIDSEHGASTGRARRVGYPDLVELRKAVQLNGVDEIALTKLDHLQRFGQSVPVAVAYTSGQTKLRTAPSSASELTKCQPVYETLPLRQEIQANTQQYDKLPKDVRSFIEFCERELRVPVTRIGIGPGRNQMIER